MIKTIQTQTQTKQIVMNNLSMSKPILAEVENNMGQFLKKVIVIVEVQILHQVANYVIKLREGQSRMLS